MTVSHEVSTPLGFGQVLATFPSGPVRAVVVLGHGAGGGPTSFDLMALAERLPGSGIAVVRYAQPWVVAGRRVAGPPASLDRGWTPALAAVRALVDAPLFVGGRSAGARVACRTLPPDARGLVLLAFPLHPPGRPAASRIGELAGAAADAVLVQGERDPFGTPDEVRAACAAVPQAGRREVHAVAGAHGFEPRTKAARAAASDLAAALCDPVLRFIEDRL